MTALLIAQELCESYRAAERYQTSYAFSNLHLSHRDEPGDQWSCVAERRKLVSLTGFFQSPMEANLRV